MFDFDKELHNLITAGAVIPDKKYYSRFIHATKKGPGRSVGMKPTNHRAGAKFNKAFRSGVATLRGKQRHSRGGGENE